MVNSVQKNILSSTTATLPCRLQCLHLNLEVSGPYKPVSPTISKTLVRLQLEYYVQSRLLYLFSDITNMEDFIGGP